jgi:tetratricopeptide (TPR) repeat protein
MSTPLPWYSGVGYFSKNDIVQAHQSFLEAYRIHPNHLHVLNNLATCDQLLNDRDKALDLYQKALQISPTFEPALRNLSAVYFNRGMYDEAYRTVRKCDPRDTLAMQYFDIIKSKLMIR